MKMEKISENQVRFTLTRSDLQTRNIKLSDLTYDSEKTKLLFKEMLDEAHKTCDFRLENTPLMIEAMPIEDGIIIIISKVENNKTIKNGFDFLPESKEGGKYRPGSFIDIKEEAPELKDPKNSKISVFSFRSIDDAAFGAKRISASFFGKSSLYKRKSLYYLILARNRLDAQLEEDNLEVLLSEYGTKQVSTNVFAASIAEHGEAIIKSNAVNILSSIF